MKNKKTEIWIETREQIIVRSLPVKFYATCLDCQTETVFLAPEHAAAINNISLREIFRLVEGGAIHFLETETGATLLCFISLSQAKESLTKTGEIL